MAPWHELHRQRKRPYLQDDMYYTVIEEGKIYYGDQHQAVAKCQKQSINWLKFV